MGWDPFRPRGTAAAAKQQRQNARTATEARELIVGLKPRLHQQLQFGNSLEPGRENAIRNALALNSRGVSQAEIDRVRRQHMAEGEAAAQQIAMELADQGYGTGATLGVRREASNQAIEAGNQYAADMNSPERKKQLAQIALELQALGMQIPDLSQFGSLASIVYGQPQVQVGAGLLETLAPIATNYVGGLGKK